MRFAVRSKSGILLFELLQRLVLYIIYLPLCFTRPSLFSLPSFLPSFLPPFPVGLRVRLRRLVELLLHEGSSRRVGAVPVFLLLSSLGGVVFWSVSLLFARSVLWTGFLVVEGFVGVLLWRPGAFVETSCV